MLQLILLRVETLGNIIFHSLVLSKPSLNAQVGWLRQLDEHPLLRLFFCWIKLYSIQKTVLVKLIISKNFLFATVSPQELQQEKSFIRTYLLNLF